MFKNVSESVIAKDDDIVNKLETINYNIKEQMDVELRKINDATEERKSLLEIYVSNEDVINKIKYFVD